MQSTLHVCSGQYGSTTEQRCTVQDRDRHCPSRATILGCLICLLSLFLLYFSAGLQAETGDESSTPEINTATTQLSENGHYKASFESIAGPIVINEIHEWRLTVLSTDGTPVDGLTIVIEGGMPSHNHGLPTAPRVTESLGEGQYRVEGFKFQMPGHWTTTFKMTDEENVSDSVTFNLML